MTYFPTATFPFVFEKNEQKSDCRKIGCQAIALCFFAVVVAALGDLKKTKRTT